MPIDATIASFCILLRNQPSTGFSTLGILQRKPILCKMDPGGVRLLFSEVTGGKPPGWMCFALDRAGLPPQKIWVHFKTEENLNNILGRPLQQILALGIERLHVAHELFTVEMEHDDPEILAIVNAANA